MMYHADARYHARCGGRETIPTTTMYNNAILGFRQNRGEVSPESERACLWRARPIQIRTHALALEEPPAHRRSLGPGPGAYPPGGPPASGGLIINLNALAFFLPACQNKIGALEISDSTGMECLMFLWGRGFISRPPLLSAREVASD